MNDPFSPTTLRDYALIADGERGALIGPHGEIAWMCAPYWDSDAVFSTLIGGSGAYSVTPKQRFVWGGYYEDDAHVRIIFEPAAGFGAHPARKLAKDEHGAWTAQAGGLRFRWSGAERAKPAVGSRSHRLTLDLTVPEGDC